MPAQEGKREKNYSNDTVYVFLQVGKESSRRRIALVPSFRLSLAESELNAESVHSLHGSMRKELKASSLKYFVAKKDYWSDFISYALLIRRFSGCEQ